MVSRFGVVDSSWTVPCAAAAAAVAAALVVGADVAPGFPEPK